MAIDDLCDDFEAVTAAISRMWAHPPQLFLIGHSLGGSIVTRVAHRLTAASKHGRAGGPRTPSHGILGIVVIDIVEESALRSLDGMVRVLSERPQSFSTLKEAVVWAIDSKLSRNPEAASLSIPDQLAPREDGRFSWRTQLAACQGCWHGWFKGLSALFASCPTARLLVLAEREYLDKPLMIASMQGKFQCAIVRESGHAIQEDQPTHLAEIIASFIERNISSTLPGSIAGSPSTVHR